MGGVELVELTQAVMERGRSPRGRGRVGQLDDLGLQLRPIPAWAG